jgi:hypothetical protein
MKQPSLLAYRHFRYFKLALLLSLLCLVAYLWHEPSPKPSGGTWLGYTLGSVGALLILWLTAYGIRKRSYRSTLGTVKGWLSAHVYLGTALVLVATLHTGFEFGWNVHTLAYALTLGVVLSGFWGLFFYLRNPDRMNAALQGETLEQHLLAITSLDNDCRNLAMNHLDHVNKALLESLEAPLFESYWQQLAGRPRHCRTAAVVQLLDGSVDGLSGEQARVNAEVYRLQLQKLARMDRLRRYLSHKAWLDVWLTLHVPLAIALLAALIAHIVSVFYFW